MDGVNGGKGLIEEHWVKSTTAFTIIIHIVVYKLFLDTYYWNVISISLCIACIVLYYGISLIGTTKLVAQLL
jgi:hypothetical protein